jgi:Ca-activated chloride channel family protein
MCGARLGRQIKTGYKSTPARYALAPHRVAVACALLVFALMAVLPAASGQSLTAAADGRPMTGLRIVGGDAAGSRFAPQLATQVKIEVTGVLVRARIRQRFVNPSATWVEGLYTFPLPDDAAVDRLRMRIGERVVEGEIHERGAADRRYRAARTRGQVTSMVKQHRPNVFSAAVANIPPGGSVEIEIAYQQRLEWRDRRFTLRFPSVVAPRYIPGEPRAITACRGVGCGAGWAPDTDQVPDASTITPPVAIAAPAGVQALELTVRVDAGFGLGQVHSESHDVTITNTGPGQFDVQLAGRDAVADRDFVLAWSPAPDQRPRVALFGEYWRGRHYALAVLMPPTANADAQRLNRELVLVIDTSGSMHGDSLAQAKRAVAKALDQLGEGDRFNLIEFNDRVHALFDQAQPVNPARLQRARSFLAGLSAEGGTEMRPALARALAQPGHAGLLRQIVFLTDGAIGNEQALFGLIERELGGSRLFTVGIGVAPNTHFMRRAARFGRGTYTFIDSVTEVDGRVGELFEALRRPVLTGLSVDWRLPPGVSPAEQATATLPDLYAGEPLVVSAVSDVPPLAVEVSGHTASQRWRDRRGLPQARADRGIHVFWARRRIADWLDARVSGVDPERIRQAVTDLGLSHHLVTPYTSLVAVDKTPIRHADAALTRAAVPVRLPAGWSAQHVFGQLPATATPARLLALTGVVMLLAALGLWSLPVRRWADRADASRW